MAIRRCPDCDGRGKHWVPLHMRLSERFVPQPEISLTAGYVCRTQRPEWEMCWLCQGSGMVVCEPHGEAIDD